MCPNITISYIWTETCSLTGAYPGFMERGFICIKVCVGVRFDDFISFVLNIPWKRNHLASLRPNDFISIGHLKKGLGRGN